jgi:hypothetical protein
MARIVVAMTVRATVMASRAMVTGGKRVTATMAMMAMTAMMVTMAVMVTTSMLLTMARMATMTPNGDDDAKQQQRQQGPSNDDNNNDNGGRWASLIPQRQLGWGTSSSPGCPHCAYGCNDAFVIMQLFPTGLTLHGIHEKSGTKKQIWTGEKSGLSGRPSDPYLSQKDNKAAMYNLDSLNLILWGKKILKKIEKNK